MRKGSECDITIVNTNSFSFVKVKKSGELFVGITRSKISREEVELTCLGGVPAILTTDKNEVMVLRGQPEEFLRDLIEKSNTFDVCVRDLLQNGLGGMERKKVYKWTIIRVIIDQYVYFAAINDGGDTYLTKIVGIIDATPITEALMVILKDELYMVLSKNMKGYVLHKYDSVEDFLSKLMEENRSEIEDLESLLPL
jgi:hypothetical protein